MRSLACLIAIVAAQVASAATISPPNPVPTFSLVRVTPGQGERVWVLPWANNPTPVDVVEAKNGDVVFTGPPGMYAVLWLSPNGQGQAFVQISGEVPPGPQPGPGPGPGPQPGPAPNRPDGFAGEVFDQAVKINDKATADKIADVCSQVRSALAAGGMTRDEAAERLINGLNQLRPPAAWKPFATWFGQQADARANTLPQMRAFLTDCITGLEAAAQ